MEREGDGGSDRIKRELWKDNEGERKGEIGLGGRDEMDNKGER